MLELKARPRLPQQGCVTAETPYRDLGRTGKRVSAIGPSKCGTRNAERVNGSRQSESPLTLDDLRRRRISTFTRELARTRGVIIKFASPDRTGTHVIE